MCGNTRPWYVPQCTSCAGTSDDEATAFARLFQAGPKRQLQGHYVIDAPLSVGRVSTVYRATSRRFPGRALALKEFSMVALFRADERRQAEASLTAAVQRWSSLRHLAIPAVLDSFTEDASLYLVTDLVEGWSLRNVIQERLIITPDLASNWGAQLCQLLAYLHAQLTPMHVPFLAPHHVMVAVDGTVKLVDWGLTSLLNPGAYGPYGSVRGYMAPELRTYSPTTMSDVFALARLLYAVLTGQLLERGAQRAVSLRRAVPGITALFARSLSQATNRDPAVRPTVAALMDALWEPQNPVEPIANWIEPPATPDAVPRPAFMQETLWPGARMPVTARPAQAAEASMADLGFVRDARYGAEDSASHAGAGAASAPSPLPAGGRPKLVVQPRDLLVGGGADPERQRLVLTLRNVGEDALTARVHSHVDWIRAPQKSAMLNPGQQAKVIVTVLTAQVPSATATEPRALSVESNGGQAWIAVTCDIPTQPILSLEQTMLDFGVVEDNGDHTLSLAIRNTGRQHMAGSVVSSVPWLSVPTGAFRCPPGKTVQVAVVLVPEALPTGEQVDAGALLVESDGGQQRVGARAWRKRAILDIGVRQLDFDAVLSGELGERYVYISNPGDGHLDGQARSLVPWLQVQPSRFACSPGQSCELIVQLDTLGLPDGDLVVPQALRIQSNAGNLTLGLRARVRAPQLSLETSELDYGSMAPGEEAEYPIVIRNVGSAPLAATLTSLLPWISVAETEIICDPGQVVRVSARARASESMLGEAPAALAGVRVSAGSIIMDITARLTVVKPALRVEPETVVFGYIPRTSVETRSLTITNDGNGPLAWSVSSNVTWLEVTPTEGSCPLGKAQTLHLTAYGLALDEDSGTATGSLVINSDGGREKVDLQVGIAAPELDVDTPVIALGPSVNGAPVTGELRVFNRGLGLLTGSVAVDRTWLVPERISFECPTGRSVRLGLATDMTEFPAGATRDAAALRVSSNGGNTEVRVELEVLSEPEIVIAKAVVLLAEQSPGGQLLGSLSIKNAGWATAHVDLSADNPDLVLTRTTYEIKPGRSVRARVELFSAQALGLGQKAQMTVKTDSQEIVVPVLLAT